MTTFYFVSTIVLPVHADPASASAFAAAADAPSPRAPAPPRRTRFSWMGGLALVVALLSLLPLGFVAWTAWQAGWQTAFTLIFRPRVGKLLVNTVLLVVFTVPLCALLAVALA